MLPNFLLIGAMKCGTSSLASQLGTHPEILMSEPKELHFFSLDEKRERGLAWYESCFAKARGEAAVGEASTTYTMHPMITGVPARIADTLPDARFLYIVRHPIRRIISNYTHDWLLGERNPMQVGDSNRDIEEVWESHPQFLPCSRYYYQIEQYLPHFPRERFLILVFEEFIENPRAIHRQIYEFLGVDPTFQRTSLAARYVTSERVREASWVWAARRVPLLKPLVKVLLPERFRRRVQRIGAEECPSVEVSKTWRRKVADTLRQDVEGLSDFTHRDFSKIWNLV